MPKPVFTSLLAALALFVSFLAIQQGRPAQAAVIGLSVSVNPGTDAGTSTAWVSSNPNVATSGRTVLVRVTDDTLTGAAPAGYVTVENDTQSIVITGGSVAGGDDFNMFETASGKYEGTFVVTAKPSETAATLEADDGDIIQITSGFLFVQLTVDSDPPNMNEADLTPAHGDVSGENLIVLEGKVTDSGAGVAREDVTLVVNGTQFPAALISFTEVVGGHSFSSFANVVDGSHTYQSRAIDGAGNAAFSDSDDATACVVNNTAGTLVNVGGLCEANTFDVDTVDPSFAMALTGLAFDADSTDCDIVTCDLDENMRGWILAVFTDASDLDGSSINPGDFFVVGHAILQVKWFDQDGMVDDARGDGPWSIRKLVFIQLKDELRSDEAPNIFISPVAGGVSDVAGNINNSAERQAVDRIGPKFVVSNFLPAPSSASLVGGNVNVTFTIAADEDTITNPTVTVWDVFSPGLVSGLGTIVSSAGINTWSVVVDEVSADTATIYNISISGEDISGNMSDLGIDNAVDAKDPADLDDDGVTAEADGILDDFFQTITDTDVCSGATTTTCVLFSNFSASDISPDAIFFEGDTKDLAAPVTIPAEGQEFDFSGEPFVVLDFGGEGNEYPVDSHGLVTLIFAQLDGVDVLAVASTEDGHRWLIPVTGLGIGPHTLVINAMDEAGNELEGAAFILQFTVTNLPLPCGDLTGDGEINVFDAIIGLQIIVGLIKPTATQLKLGDVVRDGTINVFDAILLLQHIVGLTEITECGPVP